MKNASVMTARMDLPEADVLQKDDIDCEKEFIDSSGYTNDFGEEADNVNTSALEWPVRHNSETEKCPFTCNGFRRAKAPRYTCTGRITRIPSRYLDTDSDSSDGSRPKRKAVVSRLKVKRRRKSSSSNNKLLVNGYKEHDAFSLDLTGIHSDRIICNLNTDNIKGLADIDCSEVFEEPSLVSPDKISVLTHETQAKTVCPANCTVNPTETNPETLPNVKQNGVLTAKCENESEFCSVEASMCYSQSTGSYVDISGENKGQPRSASSNISTEQRIKNIACTKQANGEFEPKDTLECCGTEGISDSCSINAHLNNKVRCDSSTESNFVNSNKISKPSKMSCASGEDNDTNISLETDAISGSCLESVASSSVVNGCLPSQIATGKLVEDAILTSVTCVDNREKIERDVCSRKPQGLNCFRNFKMVRGYARKLNQKQKRRTDRANSNSALQKQALLDQIKHKSVNKVNRTAKLHRNNLKQRNKRVVQKTPKIVKSADDTQKLDRVLGMRRAPKGEYEFLVQWANGTSCWVSSEQIITNKRNSVLRQYFMENDQDISVINRVPFQAYCCDSLSLNECQTVPGLKLFKAKDVVVKRQPAVAMCIKKGEVFVENKGGHCYITLKRETCKRKLTCLKIVDELITALEDASVSDCRLVVIKGLGSKVFSGLDIDSISKVNTEETGNIILQRTRYLVQTLANYPKPLVGLISQPAQGIGAVLLSLFDMICDEETWKKKEFVENSEKNGFVESYCLPRVVGHSIPCEEILMGKNCTESVEDASQIPEIMLEGSDTCNSTVMSTLKEIESTIHKLGKKTTSFIDMSGREILKMTNQVSNFVNSAVCYANTKTLSEDDGGILNGAARQQNLFSDSSVLGSTGSAPADRYVKELEEKVFEEKQLVQKYIEEIANIWNSSSTMLSDEKS